MLALVENGGAMITFSRSLIALAALGAPSTGIACSCGWEFVRAGDEETRRIADTQMRAAFERVPFIVVAEVVAEGLADACARAITNNEIHVPVYHTVRVHKALRGEVPTEMRVRVTMVSSENGRCAMVSDSCEVHPGMAGPAVWALHRKDEEWQFAGHCETLAVRLVTKQDDDIIAKRKKAE